MAEGDTFLVREFARLAGVTVRTLQFYDREGLLKPSAHTEAGHRLYRRADLLRLQQILTLKYLGFALDEIRDLLSQPDYDVRRSLAMQKAAIDERIGQLQQVSRALGETVELLDGLDSADLDWSLVTQTIHWLREGQKWQWVRRNYTAEQQAQLEARAQSVTAGQLVAWQRAWADLYAGFQSLLDQGRPPDATEAQRLAASMAGLLDEFTQGDGAMAASLRGVWRDIEARPAHEQPIAPALQAYAQQALAVYRGSGQNQTGDEKEG